MSDPAWVTVDGYDTRITVRARVGETRFQVCAGEVVLVEGFQPAPVVNAGGMELARRSDEAALGADLLNLGLGITGLGASLPEDTRICCGISSSSLDDREVAWTHLHNWEGLLGLLAVAAVGHNGMGAMRLLRAGEVLKLLKWGPEAEAIIAEAEEDPGEDAHGNRYRSGAREA